jgi:DNA/RNA endonuclease YhcR with UshA esterase domain
VRQIGAAEVELNEADMTLKNIEVQHETGRITLENYRKQLSELEQRKEKAETTIDGLLLRLRGEIR